MDILIRIIIMIITGFLIPYIGNIIYSPIQHFKDLSIISKIAILLFYTLCVNWFIIAPALIFMDCFKYIFL